MTINGRVIAITIKHIGASDTGSMKLGTTPGGGDSAGIWDISIFDGKNVLLTSQCERSKGLGASRSGRKEGKYTGAMVKYGK